MRPLRTNRDDEGVVIDVLCAGEDDQVHEVANATQWEGSSDAIGGLGCTQLVGNVVDHGIQTHSR